MKWLQRLFGKNHLPKSEIPEPFPPIDKEHVRRSTRLIEQAETDGANEHPTATSDERSMTEQKIRNEYQERQRQYIKNYEERQQRNLFRLRKSLGFDAVLDGLQALRHQVISQEKAAHGPVTAEANLLKSRAEELRRFRHKHQLTHRTPDYQDQWTCWLVVLVAFLAELAVTFFFLKESGGLLMVLALSATYCFLNCVAPLGIVNRWGRALSYQWGLFPLRKIIGWLVIAGTLLLGGVLNLLVGHYRSVALDLAAAEYAQDDLETLIKIAEQVNTISVTAWNNFQASYFGINDTWSWLLAVLGFLFFVAGMVEGFIKDDRYPEYGEKARRYYQQGAKYDAEADELREKREKLQKKATEHIEDANRKLNESPSRALELRITVKRLETEYKQACQGLGGDYRELISQYRQINREVRKTAPPSYFQHQPELPEAPLMDIDPPPDTTGITKGQTTRLRKEIENLQQEFETLEEIESSGKIVIPDPLTIRPKGEDCW